MKTTTHHTLNKLTHTLLAGLFAALSFAPMTLQASDFCPEDHSNLPICGDDVLVVTKTCTVAPPPAADFACSKPIDTLTMIWDGKDNGGNAIDDVTVKAYKGDTSALLLATIDHVNNGTEVSVSGYAGSPNDVTWVIYDGPGSGAIELGRSMFHLSCSDSEMNDATDCGKREGDGKRNDSNLLNDWLLEGMIDAVGTLNCTGTTGTGGTPATDCEFIGKSASCTERPTSISFRYHAGDTCLATQNNQDAGKQACEDFGTTPANAHITIGKEGGTTVVDDLDVADGEVLVGNKGSSYDSQIQILIRDAAGATLQVISMHASCSQELNIGDRFGAIEVVGFTNSKQGAVTGGGDVEVRYDYTITNTSPAPIVVVSCDDKLDPTGASYPIPPVESADIPGVLGLLLLNDSTTFTHTETRILNATTTNTLTSVVFLDLPICRKQAQATVTISDGSGGGPGPGPGPGACSVSPDNSVKIKKNKLEWKLTNTGSANAFIESIDLVWPAGNGDLTKVKRDGDEIVADDQSPTSATITTFKGNADKRRIKVGDTDTLKLEFANKADTDAGKYAITVNFVGGCSAKFNTP